MHLVEVTSSRVSEAAEALALAMLDEPSGRYLLPDRDEFVEIHRSVYVAAIERGLRDGRVDAWGDPIAGVSIWLRLPAIPGSLTPGPARPTPVYRTAPPEPSHDDF